MHFFIANRDGISWKLLAGTEEEIGDILDVILTESRRYEKNIPIEEVKR